MSALDALLGQIAVHGELIELRGTLNFADGFVVTDDPGMNTIRVELPGPVTGNVATANATPTTVIAAAATLADNTIAFIRLRVVGRIASPSTTTMAYEVNLQYRRINGGAPASFGTQDTTINTKDDAAWGTPSFSVSGNDIVVQVTGKAATTIRWYAEALVTQTPLPV
jgi:hypothetical protein